VVDRHNRYPCRLNYMGSWASAGKAHIHLFRDNNR